MQSKEPRSSFKSSWGTMKDSLSYQYQPFFLNSSFPTSPSLSTASATPSAQSAESSSSGVDSLILRRERSISIAQRNITNGNTHNETFKLCTNEIVKDINDNHTTNNKVIVAKHNIAEIVQKVYKPKKAKANINAVKSSTNQHNKTSQNLQKQKNSKPDIKILNGYVGFSCLTSQIARKSIKHGFDFNLMVVGETGLGKSTLINTMFMTDIYKNEKMVRSKKTTKVDAHQVVMEEEGVKLYMTVVDTPGYGDAVDNTDCWEPIVKYVEKQFDKFLEAETSVNRESFPDSRVHACLHFIAPTGHGLKRLDVEVMKRLHDKVNIIPVIGKADSCTREELEVFKLNIIHQLKHHKIQTYRFPDLENCKKLPFALVGSNVVIKSPEGRIFRARKYPWGAIDIEDEDHSDFSILRNLLLSKHAQDLKDGTNSSHYENFRSKKLSVLAAIDEEKLSIPNKNPLAVLEDETLEHINKVRLMEREMEEMLIKKVENKIEYMENVRNNYHKLIEEERIMIKQQNEELKSQRESFDSQKELFEAQMLLSPSHSDKSTTSVGSNGKKKMFRFSFGSFKFKANDDK